jgi:hypothetical protein
VYYERNPSRSEADFFAIPVDEATGKTDYWGACTIAIVIPDGCPGFIGSTLAPGKANNRQQGAHDNPYQPPSFDDFQ